MHDKDDQKGKLISFSVGSGLAGLADSSEVFPVYIGDDRTDEDAFKVRISCFLFIILEILYVQIFPYKLQISCWMFLDSCNRKLLKLCVCVFLQVLKNLKHGCGILVTSVPKETKASFSLRDPHEVKSFAPMDSSWFQKLSKIPENLYCNFARLGENNECWVKCY